MSISEKLAHLKQQRGLTTGETSQKTHIPVGTLNKILSGQTRNPSLNIITQLCAFFQVPAHYLLDDSIPASCFIHALDETEGTLMLSERERDLFFQFRQLDECGRRHLEYFLQYLLHQSLSFSSSDTERRLICYLPIGMGRFGILADSCQFRTIRVPVSPITREADYAIHVMSNSLEPAYSPGTILAVKKMAVENNQLGLFILNGEAFICNFYSKRGIRKLISLNLARKNICIQSKDNFCCLGAVLGAIRNYHWE